MIDIAVQLDLAARLILAAALGAAIGSEREIHGHPAGIRTHMLVAFGSALFTVLSIHGFGQDVAGSTVDPTRIAAQIVSGIGFLGAGAILKDGIAVRGLTTAASLWATSAVGMAGGAGEYVLSVVGAAVILISLGPLNALAERLRGSAAAEIQLRVHLERMELVGEVMTTVLAQKFEVASISTKRLSKASYETDFSLRGPRSATIARVVEALSRIDGVEVISTSESD
jgi:putative Mg2+ transporter-C (MgtC) family protein